MNIARTISVTNRIVYAGIAQLVEQLICNQQVVGSNPTAGSAVNSNSLNIAASMLGHFRCATESFFGTRANRP